jgi:hypothetical protein
VFSRTLPECRHRGQHRKLDMASLRSRERDEGLCLQSRWSWCVRNVSEDVQRKGSVSITSKCGCNRLCRHDWSCCFFASTAMKTCQNTPGEYRKHTSQPLRYQRDDEGSLGRRVSPIVFTMLVCPRPRASPSSLRALLLTQGPAVRRKRNLSPRAVRFTNVMVKLGDRQRCSSSGRGRCGRSF